MRPRGFWRVTLALLLAGCFAALGLPATALASYAGFSDIESSEWYVKSGDLDYVLANGIMGGYDDGRFGPSDPVNRAQAATILWRMAGEPAAESEEFPDADYSAFYGEALRWTRSTNVITGYSDGRFGPSDPVTREQLATMLYRYATSVANKDVNTDPTALSAISGSRDVSGFAWDAMAWAVNEGILTGDMSAGYARALPQGTASRAQMVKMTAVFHRGFLDAPGVDTGSFDPNSPTIAVFADNVIDLQGADVEPTVEGDTISARISGIQDDVKVGDIVLLPDSNELPFGAAVKVESVSRSSARSFDFWIFGSLPSLYDLFAEFQLNEELDMRDLRDAVADKGKIDLFDSVSVSASSAGVALKLNLELGDYAEVTGNVLIEDFYALLQYKKERVWFGDDSDGQYINVEVDSIVTPTLSVKVSALPQEFKKVQLVSIPVPCASLIGTGTGVYLNLYLILDVNGTVSLSTTVSFDASAHKNPGGKLALSGNCTSKGFDDLSVEIAAKTGTQASIALQVVGFPIVDAGVETGMSSKIKSSFHPDLLCTDVRAWLYAECFAELLGESSFNLKATQELMNESNSLFSKSFHIENGQVVPECTWENNPKRKAAQLFLDKIDELKATYGKPGLVDDDWTYSKGLCYAELIDFGDGKERLLVAYCTSSNPAYDADAYWFEVWEYDDEDSTLRRAIVDTPPFSNGGTIYLTLCHDENANVYLYTYVIFSEFSTAMKYYGLLDDGTLGIAHLVETKGEPGGPYSHWIDGVEVNEEAVDQFVSLWYRRNTKSCYLVGSNDLGSATQLTPSECLRTVNKVTSELQSRL